MLPEKCVLMWGESLVLLLTSSISHHVCPSTDVEDAATLRTNNAGISPLVTSAKM